MYGVPTLPGSGIARQGDRTLRPTLTDPGARVLVRRLTGIRVHQPSPISLHAPVAHGDGGATASFPKHEPGTLNGRDPAGPAEISGWQATARAPNRLKP